MILGLLWQIIRHALLKNISLAKNINIAALLRPGEDLSSLDNLAPEQIIMRWVNHHLQHAADNDQDDAMANSMRNSCGVKGDGEFVGNFGKDLSNSVAYINLINQISPDGSKVRVTCISKMTCFPHVSVLSFWITFLVISRSLVDI